MPYTIILHISNSDPVVGEVEELPTTKDNLVAINNPRRLDRKALPYLAENVRTVYWPIDRVNFIEVLGGKEEEEIIGFVRE